MCLRIAADGDVLGDRGDSSVHDRHAPRHPLPHVWHHGVLGREFICLSVGRAILQLQVI